MITFPPSGVNLKAFNNKLYIAVSKCFWSRLTYMVFSILFSKLINIFLASKDSLISDTYNFNNAVISVFVFRKLVLLIFE